MSKTLSQQTIGTIKASIPVLQTQGLAIVRRMYDRMFQIEAIRAQFNQSHQAGDNAQAHAVAGAILAYAHNIDNPVILEPVIERIAQKHASMVTDATHYPHVAEALLGGMADVLGAAATPDLLAAWADAYWFLADILIAREAAIFREQARTLGGWNGWRDFRVVGKRAESQIITSFRLVPVDGLPVLRHRPGQFLSFDFTIPEFGTARRNYSISSAPDGVGYRITVKREPEGVVSNWLHDVVEPGDILRVAAPAGDFFLTRQPSRPIVLLSGGVGLTPLVSMMESLVGQPGLPPVHFIHAARNGAVHAMGGHVRALAARRLEIAVTLFYSEPAATDRLGQDYDQAGLIDLDWLATRTPIAEAEYYLSGPRGFLQRLVTGLGEAGVSEGRLFYEFFGPAENLAA